jgi:hypothetical protein
VARALLPAVLLLLPALALGQATPEVKAEPVPAASAVESAPAATAVAIDPGTAAKPAGPGASAGIVDPRTWGTRESEWKSHRELAGHVFIPSSVIVDPFSQTAFGLRFGLGGGSATGPSVVWTGDPSNPFVPGPDKDYPYYGLGFGLDASVRFLEWLSARLAIGGDAYLGSGRDSILVVGTQVKVLADLGLKGSFNVGKNFRLAFGLDATYGPAMSVLVAQGIREAFQAGDPEFLKRTNTITWIPGFYGAWAPFPFLGASLNLQYINPMTTQTGTSSYTQNGWSLAGGVDFDLAPLVRAVPIGLSVAYKLVGPLGSTGVTRIDSLDVGLFYTGRKDLALGLEIDMRWTTLQGDLASTATVAILVMRYYF